MRRGGERVYRDGRWHRHGPPHWHVSPEARNFGGIGIQAGCYKGVGLWDNRSMWDREERKRCDRNTRVRTGYKKKNYGFGTGRTSICVNLGLGVHHGRSVIMAILIQVQIFPTSKQWDGAIARLKRKCTMSFLINTNGMCRTIIFHKGFQAMNERKTLSVK